MTEENKETVEATVVTHLVPAGTTIVEGKKVAVLPEEYYKTHKYCPHCNSTVSPEYISDLKEASEIIADAVKCADCQDVYIVLVHPKIYLSQPILMNWLLKEKGATPDGEAEEKISASEDGSKQGSAANV
jgi:hypothetical protein